MYFKTVKINATLETLQDNLIQSANKPQTKTTAKTTQTKMELYNCSGELHKTEHTKTKVPQKKQQKFNSNQS